MDFQLTPRAERALRTAKRTHPTSFAKPRKFYDRDKGIYIVTEGVASTGEVSPKGTIYHVEHRSDSGRLDAGVRPQTIRARLTPEGEIINYG